MKENKVFQPEQKEILRSEIHYAHYNPRKISKEAKAKLKANIKRIGLLGGVVWNENTRNLVSGHQRVAILDEINHYDIQTQKNDYLLRVEVVRLDETTEKEQNLFMNNRSVQGEYDRDMLQAMLHDIDYSLAGFDDFDLNILGISVGVDDIPPDLSAQTWSKQNVMGDEMLSIDKETKQSPENSKLDRSKNFYTSTPEEQIARHNEVEKIKTRIMTSKGDNDNGALSYVVLSFRTPTNKEGFMIKCGFPPMDKYIDGEEFSERIDLLD